MKNLAYAVVLAVTVSASLSDAFATDRYYSDITAESPSKRFKVTAESPDNARKKGRIAFQASFVYTFRDTSAKRVLWTRKQAMGKPLSLGEGSTETYSFPVEASPVDIFVSDTGWTVIRTGRNELIAVDLAGHDRGCIGLLSEAFTKEEKDQYVHDTTAGPMWSAYSLWYFLNTGGKQLFVVRPWWGRRVFMDLETGKLVRETDSISASAATYERNYVLTELAKGVENRKTKEQEERCADTCTILTASYLAGRIHVEEAIPLLERLQNSPYIGSSTIGGLGIGERFEGEVNPHDYSTFTLRQVVHLSLRRLGKAPRPFPLNEFDVQYKIYKKCHPYTPKALSATRAANTDKVTKGMKAEQVLDLIGAPDFVGSGTWEYDMDSSRPFSLILKWDVMQVADIQKEPPLWKEGFVRDEQIVD